jgi:hypothetical protein
MQKIDTLSPSFFFGLIGYAVEGSGRGFWIGSVVVWLALVGVIVLAAALAKSANGETTKANSLVLHALEPAE